MLTTIKGHDFSITDMNLANNRISVDEKSRDLAQFVNEIQKK